ncbi:class I SAM-dependent methyltransferase [Pokkaliibacter sp. CJK22405]|uniref:class I SAM-dependent methyltransferase n=1 Tax=Pokkaliibacter sp. CJK22405 TaxID=3384615 RepID=UPI003984EBD1
MTPLRLSYRTIEFGDIDIHVCTLRDTQEFFDPDGKAEKLGISSASWPLFGVIWPSSMVLAHHMATYDIANKRILEVGCGMALSSLLLKKLNADITATDHHPEVETFLERNSLLNEGESIAFERIDWAEKQNKLGRFDLIIGSDLLYEDAHVELLSGFIRDHANPTCEVILVDPGRGRKTLLSKQLLLQGFDSVHSKPAHTDYLTEDFQGYILTFKREAVKVRTINEPTL